MGGPFKFGKIAKTVREFNTQGPLERSTNYAAPTAPAPVYQPPKQTQPTDKVLTKKKRLTGARPSGTILVDENNY